MRARPTYTDAQIRAFIAAARGGRDNRAELLDAMRRHPAGKGARAPRPNHPPMTNADGTLAELLDATDPEDHR